MISRIRNNLFISGVRDLNQSVVDDNKITAILNVAVEAHTPDLQNVTLRKQAFRDSAEDASRSGHAAIETLKDLLSSGHTVLVHCKQGKSRSTHVIASALADIENKGYFDAYQELRDLHSDTLWYSIGQEIKEKNL